MTSFQRRLITTALLPTSAAIASAATGSPEVPFAFVGNAGQAGTRVRYIGTGPEFKAWFEDRGVIFERGGESVSFSFEGGAVPAIEPIDPIPAKANYIHGNNPREWRTDLPLFSGIRYRGIWPGVELTYRAQRTRIEAEYLVEPGASIDGILLRFDGLARVLPDGRLSVHGETGDFLEDKPVMSQTIDGREVAVEGGFRALGNGLVGFRVSGYDLSQPLVIDPSILLSGYFGGTGETTITAIGFDALNNVVVAGYTSSTDLPASGGVKTHDAGGVDVFVASFNPTGGQLNWCTYLGGSGDDRAFGLAIDGSRYIYLTGWTQSVNFPLAGPIQARLSGTRDAFVARLSPAGNSLIYSTYLGGSGNDTGYSIALDGANSAVIAGDTTSVNFPTTYAGFQRSSGGGQDAFVAKISPGGNILIFSSYLGGSSVDHAAAVKVDGSGNVVIGGYTESPNFRTASAFQSRLSGGQDAFVTKLDPNADALIFSTYFGGSSGSVGAPEEVNALAVDQSGNVIVAGTTPSANFPVTSGAWQTVFGGETDGFVSRFSPQGALLYSTYVGGSLSDSVNGLALDFYGEAYVTGSTDSTDFPVQRPFQNANAGNLDAFVVKLNTTLSSPLFSTYLGGSGSESGNAIAVDAETSILVAGQTSSPDFPVSGNLGGAAPSVLSSFITKIAPNFTMGIEVNSFFVFDGWHVFITNPTSFGNPGDLPIVGDWTGSGVKRIGVFRNGTWILDITGNGVMDSNVKTISFGQAGDVPIVGDWLGTGRIALGLFRSGSFILDLSGHLTGIPTGQNDVTFSFGLQGDIPVAADWNGSGTTKVGIFRSGAWWVDYNGNRVWDSGDKTYNYGTGGDIPVTGDWDSSGNNAGIGVYRGGYWILDYDRDNAWTTLGVNEMFLQFGASGFTPLVK